MSASEFHPAPPFDVELAAALAIINEQEPSTVTPDMIQPRRAAPTLSLEEILDGRDVTHREETFAGPGGNLLVSLFQRNDHSVAGVGVVHTHGGGMIFGDRFSGIETMLDWVEELDAVVVSVEYRLAPEHPDPAPVEDCYAALVWTAENAARLGIDANKLVIAGGSAGGGLAAGTALLARDRQGPALAAQMLIYPMLDDRNETVSSYQIDGKGIWDRGSNDTGWDALLGDRRKTDDVSIYAAPSRATDLSNLPPAFIDVGTAEVFRDEDVAYASTIWTSGGHCELHVWPGGFHAYDVLAPFAALSAATQDARLSWLRRTLGI